MAMKAVVSAVILLVLVFDSRYAVTEEIRFDDLMPGQCGNVFITVSSLKGSYLELNWSTNCTKEGDIVPDTIALYEKDIRIFKTINPILKIDASRYPNGYYKTKINITRTQDGFLSVPGWWNFNSTTIPPPGAVCYPYWLASFGGADNRLLDITCFKLEPTWMNDNSQVLFNRTIGSLVLPGTHDSGSYIPNLLLNDYILTQDLNVYSQLVSGIRYLDLRIGYYDSRGFTINHDVVRVQNFMPVVEQITNFVRKAPKEVIILDFHRFPVPQTWSDDLHEQFIAYLQTSLVEFAMDKNMNFQAKGPTLGEMWNSRKNLILSYSVQKFSDKYSFLWPPLRQSWADTTNVTQLKTFMDSALIVNKDLMYSSLMAELTPSALDLLLHRNPLRQLADNVNRNLTKWVRDEWQDKCNIVATDFFLGNDLINLSIKFNTNKLI